MPAMLAKIDDKRTGAIVIVMQRVHMDDLTGFLSGYLRGRAAVAGKIWPSGQKPRRCRASRLDRKVDVQTYLACERGALLDLH
jgi:hypothetical protein